MRRSLGFLILIIGLSGCKYFAPEESQKKPLARVNQTYLYLEDILDLLGPNMTPADSALIIQNQVNRWATQQLLIDQAKINLSLNLQTDLEELIQQYRIDLYTEFYKGKIVTAQLDSVVGLEEMQEYGLRINDFLRGLFLGIGLKLVDFKIEFGRYFSDDDDGVILLADEISPDNCRLWDIKTNNKYDKDLFRQELGGLKEAYQENL